MLSSHLHLLRYSLILIIVLGLSEYTIMMLFGQLHLEQKLPSTLIALLDACSLILLSAPPVYFWIIRPILKKSKDQSQKHAALISALDGAGDSVVITNHQGNFCYVNHAFSRITGYAVHEVIGKNPSILQSGKQDKKFYETMWASIHKHGEWRGELWNKRKDGSQYLETLHITSVLNPYENKPCYIGIMSDITDKKYQESLLQQNEKMASIGTLVGGIAHHFNNLLSGIIGNAYLGQDVKNPEKTNQRLQKIEEISFEASSIVKQLLIFAHDQEPKKHNISIIPVLEEIIEIAKQRLPKDINFEVNITDTDMIVYCDSAKIQQVMMNILTNAADALPTTGPRRIHICIQASDSAHCEKHDQCSASSSQVLRISISDSGHGISKEDIPKIFDPFFTSNDHNQRTGLGLSTAFATIQAHAGSIQVESKQSHGSSFDICLPLASNDLDQDNSDITNKQDNSDICILIVDDDDAVKNTLKQILQSLGYQTISASHGKEAKDLVLEQKQNIDLIISDIVMPVMDGLTSVKAIRHRFPQLPVIFITAYKEKNTAFMRNNNTKFISKPFNIQELKYELKELLQNSEPQHKTTLKA